MNLYAKEEIRGRKLATLSSDDM